MIDIRDLRQRLHSASLALPGEHSEIDGEPVNLNVCTQAADVLARLDAAH